MHGTHLSDLQQSCPLRGGQSSGELETPINTIELSCRRLALGAIHGMNPRMLEPHDDMF
jgi:hypothetical protein